MTEAPAPRHWVLMHPWAVWAAPEGLTDSDLRWLDEQLRLAGLAPIVGKSVAFLSRLTGTEGIEADVLELVRAQYGGLVTWRGEAPALPLLAQPDLSKVPHRLVDGKMPTPPNWKPDIPESPFNNAAFDNAVRLEKRRLEVARAKAERRMREAASEIDWSGTLERAYDLASRYDEGGGT